MEYLDLAKCGMLEQFVRSSIGLPLWQSGMVATLFLASTFVGLLLASRYREIAISFPTVWHWVAILAGSILVLAGVAVVIGQVQYLFFLLRMSKDALYCTYFGASRALNATQSILITLVIALNLVWGMWFCSARLVSPDQPRKERAPLPSVVLVATGILICATYVACILFEAEVASIAVVLCIVGTMGASLLPSSVGKP
jgi:hypothetical protein